MRYVPRILRRDPERDRPVSLVVSRHGRDKPASLGRASGQRDAVDAAVIAYVEWRSACTDVRDAYRRWAQASVVDAELAYRAYGAAVDREQAAAEVYALLMRSIGDLVESGLDYPLNATSSLADTSS